MNLWIVEYWLQDQTIFVVIKERKKNAEQNMKGLNCWRLLCVNTVIYVFWIQNNCWTIINYILY